MQKWPHAATGHKFQHQPVALVVVPEKDLIHCIFFKYLELGEFSSPEKFVQCGIVTWICDFGIKGFFDKIEKSGYEGEAEFFGVLAGRILISEIASPKEIFRKEVAIKL